MSSKKKLLIVTSTFPRWIGDTEPSFVFELAKRLAVDFNVTVLAPHTLNAKVREQIAGIEVERFRYCYTPWQTLCYEGGIMAKLKANRLRFFLVPLFALAQFFSLLSIVRKKNIDVVHAHWLIPQGAIAVAATRLVNAKKRPAIICTSHGSDILLLQGAWLRWLKRKIISRLSAYTVVSKALQSQAQTQGINSHLKVIPMGVDLQSKFTVQPNIQREKYTLLFVGRLVVNKGVEFLIQALPEILKKFPETRLYLVGDGPDRQRLLLLAGRLNLSNHIHFMGAIENHHLSTLYLKASMFVSPSLSEGLGLTLVEAMGCECPVIASNIPGITDVVELGVTGWLCSPKNPTDIACKVIDCFENPEMTKEITLNARNHVLNNYDWPIIANAYSKLIKDSISTTVF